MVIKCSSNISISLEASLHIRNRKGADGVKKNGANLLLILYTYLRRCISHRWAVLCIYMLVFNRLQYTIFNRIEPTASKSILFQNFVSYEHTQMRPSHADPNRTELP